MVNGSTHPLSLVGEPRNDETYSTTPSGSAPNDAEPMPSIDNTSSPIAGSIVVVGAGDVVVVVVDVVVVEVDVVVVLVVVDVGGVVVVDDVVVVSKVTLVVDESDSEVDDVSDEQPTTMIARAARRER